MPKKPPKKNYYRDDNFLKQVGEKIREVRERLGISQEALANGCGTNYSQINRMELGKANFTMSYLNRIAMALGVNPKELLP